MTKEDYLEIGYSEEDAEWLSENEPLPHWAIGKTSSYTEVGAQLNTKDGRRMGNSCVLEYPVERHDLVLAKIITDAGNVLHLTEGELEECFYQPVYKMNPSTCPGMKQYQDNTVEIKS